MAMFLFSVLAAVTVAMLAWTIRNPNRILQYPFVACLAWGGFAIPQAAGVLRNPQMLNVLVRRDHGVEMTLLMYVLCALMGFLGYLCVRTPVRFRHPPLRINDDRLFLGTAGLLVVSFLGYAGLTRLSGGGVFDFFSTDGNYMLDWSGITLVYNFFAQTMSAVLACAVVAALLKPTKPRLVLLAAASLLPLGMMFFLGRRSHSLRFILIVLCALYFHRGWVLPRWAAIAAVLVACLAVFVAPQFRTHSQIGGDWSQLRNISVRRVASDLAEGETSIEFENAAVIIPAYYHAGEIKLGRGLYNQLVKQFVPGTFIGAERKQSLLIETPDQDALTRGMYGWKRHFASAVPGPADAFREFWYAGCLLYFLIGILYRLVWERALQGSLPAQLFYSLLIYMAAASVAGPVSMVLPKIVFDAFPLVPLLFLAREHEAQGGQGAAGTIRPAVGTGAA